MISKLDTNIPKLGFGLMRLPKINDVIDIEQLKQMVDVYLEKGFTYFDTAWGYEKSEEAIKTALVDRYPRDRYLFATKMPAWMAHSKQEAEEMFWTSLRRTGLAYFDFYLLHNLGGTDNIRTDAFDKYDIWDFTAEQKRAGRIKHLGCSVHASAEHLDEILTAHPELEFVQLQINYSDWDNPAIQSGKCYEVARKHDKPVIIMEPVKGGALAALPEKAAALLHRSNPHASQASWAIRYAASLDGIMTVLSGMSTLEQLQNNVSFMTDFVPLDQDELKVIAEVQAVLSENQQIPCTDCQYCLKGCPQNIAIPSIFKAKNDYLTFGDISRAKEMYAFQTRKTGKAHDCICCGMCEQVCPQGISIMKELTSASAAFDV